MREHAPRKAVPLASKFTKSGIVHSKLWNVGDFYTSSSRTYIRLDMHHKTMYMQLIAVVLHVGTTS